MQKSEPKNLYELKPVRLVEWERDGLNRVTLVVPKFRRGVLSRILQPRLRRPFFRVKLDEFGSFVWLASDGLTTIRTMGEQMQAKFGETVEPLYDRLARFLHQLEDSKLVAFAPSSPLSRQETD
jgi:hypothetical protein